jgi:hypothetical protein
VTGITKDLYLWAKWRLGFRPKCNCNKTQESANTLGKNIASKLRKLLKLNT